MSHAGLRYPFETPPADGEAFEVAEGVLWIRMPLPMVLDHVNCYALDEGDHWSIVDTGFASKRSRAIWQAVLDGPLKGKPVGRVIVTHHHPDHIGLAGWMQSEMGASLWATRTTWLFARMLTLDAQDRPSPETLAFWQAAGTDLDILAKRKQERPFNFADVVAPLPLGFQRIRQGDVLRAAGRDWDVHIGNGHSPEHATLWSRDDNLVLSGDQILPSISPNIGVYATEPEADPVAEWLEACERLALLAREDHLVLGGHKLPFTGLPLRMHQLIENHHGALARLEAYLDTPKTGGEVFPPLLKRRIGEGEYGLALVAAIAHPNHLHQTARITREKRDDGMW